MAKNDVAYDCTLKPYQLKDANPSMQHLQQLLGRSQLRSNSKSTTTGELDDAMKQLAEHYFEPDQHDPQDIADNDEASGEDSDDDPEVDTLLDHALTFLTQTLPAAVLVQVCALLSRPSWQPNEFPLGSYYE